MRSPVGIGGRCVVSPCYVISDTDGGRGSGRVRSVVVSPATVGGVRSVGSGCVSRYNCICVLVYTSITVCDTDGGRVAGVGCEIVNTVLFINSKQQKR